MEKGPKVVCPRGPYSVKAGGNRKIRLNVSKGDTVRGLLEEISEQPFDYYIADDPNLVYFKQRNFRKFKPIDEDHNEPAYHVDVQIPSDGRWWLILDMYNFKFSRSIRVDFEEIQPTANSSVPEQVVRPGGQLVGCDNCNFPQTLYPPDSERIILKSEPCAQGDSKRVRWKCNKCQNANVRYWDRHHPLIGFAKIR
jgi:hypothetical protein